MKMSQSLFVVLLTVLLLSTADTVDGDRVKRSDDMRASEIVVEQLSQQVNQLTAELTALKSKFELSTTRAAFQVQPSTDVNLGPRATVVYDVVLTNIGKAYDNHTGFFTAPVSGSYAFSLSCMASSGYVVSLDIVANDVSSTTCFSVRYSGEHSDLGTAFITVYLRGGQRVWTRNQQNTPIAFGGSHWATFTGFLVQADV